MTSRSALSEKLTADRVRDVDDFLKGNSLYGDDFDEVEIASWYADEKEGYANLGAADGTKYRYEYHAWNDYHAYRHLPDGEFRSVLGLGSAYGDEFLPIISRIKALTIVDPSSAFVQKEVHGVPAIYIRPAIDGRLALSDESFDLISCFGVLHHIPNVSFVVSEMFRLLKPNCYMVLREPIVSMGDWRLPRMGLTKRERGIPWPILQRIASQAGFEVVKKSLCDFPLTARLFAPIRSDVFNSRLVTRVDAFLAQAFSWNVNYHPRRAIDRFRPTSAFLVLRKPAPAGQGSEPAR
jgi:SAM-dependent methyltransferase